MPSSLPFTLRGPDQDEVTGTDVRSTRERYHGVARLTATQLVLEWRGERERTEVTGMSVRNQIEPLPVTAIELPASVIADASLRRRWWRPYLRLRLTDLTRAATIPGARGGECRLLVSRADWAGALEFLMDLRLLMAETALRDAEAPPELPSGF